MTIVVATVQAAAKAAVKAKLLTEFPNVDPPATQDAIMDSLADAFVELAPSLLGAVTNDADVPGSFFLHLPNVVAESGPFYSGPQGSGSIVRIVACLNSALSGNPADTAILTFATNRTGSYVDITDGGIVFAGNDSPGKVRSSAPTAQRAVQLGDTVRCSVSGTNAVAAVIQVNILLQQTGGLD